MKKATKIWLIIATCLVLLGGILFAAGMSAHNWDFTKLSTVKYETNKFDITEEFKNISIETDGADITFLPSENDKCYVECHEEEKVNHSLTVKEDTLVVDVVNEKSWYDYIGIHFDSSEITVYLPKREYESLSIKESTGDIRIPESFTFDGVDVSLSTGDVDFSASAGGAVKIKANTGDVFVKNGSVGSLDVTVSTGSVRVSDVAIDGKIKLATTTGDAYLTNVTCQELVSKGSAGDITLKNVIATNEFSIKSSTGDVKLEGSDAAEIFIETATGDVKGKLLTDKVFIAETDTGNIKVPKTTIGGRCEITTNTGDIKFD